MKTYDVRLTLSDEENAMLKKLKNVYFKNSNDNDLTIHEVTTLLTYAIHILDIHVSELEEAIQEMKQKKNTYTSV